MTATKMLRIVELVKIVLAQLGIKDDELLTCIDCVLALPDAAIPKERGLRYFAWDLASYYLGLNDNARTHYPQAARHVRSWKSKWGDTKEPPSRRAYPVILARLDCNLNFVAATGGGFTLLGIHPDSLIGRNARELCDDNNDWWLRQLESSVAGRTMSQSGYYGGRLWQYVTMPDEKEGLIAGVVSTATAVPTNFIYKPNSRIVKLLGPGRRSEDSN